MSAATSGGVPLAPLRSTSLNRRIGSPVGVEELLRLGLLFAGEGVVLLHATELDVGVAAIAAGVAALAFPVSDIGRALLRLVVPVDVDRKSTRLNSSHVKTS